jgi:Signal peptidase, peptidase S26
MGGCSAEPCFPPASFLRAAVAPATLYDLRTTSNWVYGASEGRYLLIDTPLANGITRGGYGYVYVNGVRFDQIETPFFPKVTLGKDRYYVMGDNRTFSQDSRDFGPVPRDAIFARVILIYWPLSHFGGIPARKAGPPPGQIPC